MNPEQIFKQLQKFAVTLSGKQIAGLLTVFIAVVGVLVGSAYWISAPDYMLLVADMDAETASAVVSKLKDSKVPYQLTDGGRTVRVPAERVDELRLQFASGGLPSAGRIGFEIFDKPAFGTTEFLEHVNYRRALEGELARTISTLAEVSSARVHIAMAKDSLFVDQAEPAKASVVLRLKANRPLAPATAQGIAGLISASVESMRPESVVILDTFGRSLSKPEGAGDGAASFNLDRQQQIERDLSTKVVTLLEPVVGPGRVRVNVSAYLKADAVEQTEERWDPAAVVRSKQSSTETGASNSNLSTGGVAGARANQPPAASATTTPPANAAATAPGTTPATGQSAAMANAVALITAPGRSSETTNYEVGKLTRHTLSPQGQLGRLSVAVIVDDEHVVQKAEGAAAATSTTKPWEPAEIQRFQKLVAAAVGLDAARGDQLTVENISFEAPVEEPLPPVPTLMERLTEFGKENWTSALRVTSVMLLASFAFFGVLRPLARRATSLATVPALPSGPSGVARLPTVQEMEGQIEARQERPAQPPIQVMTKRVAKLANEEPEQLAKIVRGWIAEEDQ